MLGSTTSASTTAAGAFVSGEVDICDRRRTVGVSRVVDREVLDPGDEGREAGEEICDAL